MNLFLNEMRMYRKSLLTWLITLPVLCLLFMLMYPPIASEMDLFLQFIDSFPIELREAMGITSFTFGGLIGFYSLVLTYILLAGSVQATTLGLSVLSAEVRDKTADFLYAKPVSRDRIIGAKVAAVFCQLVLVNLVFGVFTWASLALINRSAGYAGFDFRIFALLTGTLFFLQVFFACIGLLLSAILTRVRTVLPISLGVVFFFYILFVLNQTLDRVELSYLTPFGYFELARVMADNAYDLRHVLAMIAMIAVFLLTTRQAYLKKDLPSI